LKSSKVFEKIFKKSKKYLSPDGGKYEIPFACKRKKYDFHGRKIYFTHISCHADEDLRLFPVT